MRNNEISMGERVENFKSYYSMKNQRALFGFFVGSEYPLKRYYSSKCLPEDRPLQPEDFVVEDYLEDLDRLFAEHESCGGDFIFSASAFWGIPWLEAILQCPIFADHSTGSIHSGKPTYDVCAGNIPKFDANNPWVQKMGEFMDKIAMRCNGRYPIGTTRMRGISD